MIKFITLILLSIFIVAFGIQIFFTDFEKFKFFTTIFGAIIGFYFAYKRYERDKEIEILDKYGHEYDMIILELNRSNNEDKGPIYDKLLNIWYKEFYLYSKGYITYGLWREWHYWIGLKLEEIFRSDPVLVDIFTDRLFKYYNYGFINNDKWSVVFGGGYYARIKIKFGGIKFGEQDFYMFLLNKIKYLEQEDDLEFTNFLVKYLKKLGLNKIDKSWGNSRS